MTHNSCLGPANFKEDNFSSAQKGATFEHQPVEFLSIFSFSFLPTVGH